MNIVMDLNNVMLNEKSLSSKNSPKEVIATLKIEGHPGNLVYILTNRPVHAAKCEW